MITKPGFWKGVLIGGLLTAPLIALFFLGDALLGLALVPYDLFDAVARFPGGKLYGRVLIFGIEVLVSVLTALNLDVSETAKPAENILAVVGHFATGALIGGIAFAIMRRFPRTVQRWSGLLLGILVGLPIAMISLLVNQTASAPPFVNVIWIVALHLGWGVGIMWLFQHLTMPVAPETSLEVVSRRQFLVQIGTASAAITVVGAGLSAVLNTRGDAVASLDENDVTVIPTIPAAVEATRPAIPEGPNVHLIDPRAAQIAAQAREQIENLPNADDPLIPAPGTRPEYTPLEDHYRIDINSRPPEVDGNDWLLTIDGLVDHPLTLSLADLRNNYDPQHHLITLACVSNPVGGDLVSTTLWTGVRLKDVIADVGPQGEATHIEITAKDGFHEAVSLDLINSDPRIMLTYFWDGRPLRQQNGYPLRIYIPDRFGMKQPKWIKHIELLGRERAGFWILRGWDKDAFIKATSVIDTVAVDAVSGDPPHIPIGGMALAGARGISRVEVRVDEGEWVEADLRTPLSEVSWVIWRYEWPFTPGEHLFEVRCFDGNGIEQIADDRPPPPSGASGIHNVTETF